MKKNGILHREDGPAVEWIIGTKEWYVEGKLHREDGPAIENFNGSKCWSIEGLFHRLDGPAVELADGRIEYWVHGKNYNKPQFREVSVRFWEVQRENPELTLEKVNELVRSELL